MKASKLITLAGIAGLTLTSCMRDSVHRYTGMTLVHGYVVDVKTTSDGYEMMIRDPYSNAQIKALDKNFSKDVDLEITYKNIPSGNKIEEFLKPEELKNAFNEATKRRSTDE